MKKKVLVFLAVGFITACGPKIGTAKWCEKMEDKPSGEWTMNEAKDYATHCLFKSGE